MKFKRIKDLREDNDKLQKDIANLLGISQQYYSEYENGKRTIPIQHLITLANYYNTSIDYIVGLSDIKTNSKNKKKPNDYTNNNGNIIKIPKYQAFSSLVLTVCR